MHKGDAKMVCVKVVQTRLVGWTNNVVEKETRMVEKEPKNDNGLILYGIRVEKAYRYIPWGELEIVGVHTKTGRYESMSFEDPITRWKVEKELKNAEIPIENVFLNFYYWVKTEVLPSLTILRNFLKATLTTTASPSSVTSGNTSLNSSIIFLGTLTTDISEVEVMISFRFKNLKILLNVIILLQNDSNRNLFIFHLASKLNKVMEMVCGKMVQTRLNEFVDRETAEYWRDMHKLGIHSVNELLELIV